MPRCSPPPALLHRADDLDVDQVAALLGQLGELAVTRLPITTTLLSAAWGLRDNVAACAGLHVAAVQHCQLGWSRPTIDSCEQYPTGPSILAAAHSPPAT